MGYDMSNSKGDEAHLTMSLWSDFFRLAMEYGWEPMGTVSPYEDNVVWDGGYFSNDFQLVTETDAANLANALEKAIRASPKRAFADWIRSFIDFCRGGGFSIG
jgi:hypothetical protein